MTIDTIPFEIAETAHALRRAFGGEIGQVHRHQFPAGACGRIVGEEVDALRDAVVADHQPVEQGDVVSQATRFTCRSSGLSSRPTTTTSASRIRASSMTSLISWPS